MAATAALRAADDTVSCCESDSSAALSFDATAEAICAASPLMSVTADETTVVSAVTAA